MQDWDPLQEEPDFEDEIQLAGPPKPDEDMPPEEDDWPVAADPEPVHTPRFGVVLPTPPSSPSANHVKEESIVPSPSPSRSAQSPEVPALRRQRNSRANERVCFCAFV